MKVLLNVPLPFNDAIPAAEAEAPPPPLPLLLLRVVDPRFICGKYDTPLRICDVASGEYCADPVGDRIVLGVVDAEFLFVGAPCKLNAV